MNKVLWLIVLVFTIIILATGCTPKYKEIDYEKICKELSQTNKYLIKSCHENGGEIKIIYDDTNSYIKEISCVR